MAITGKIQFLNFLSDFWLDYYEDAEVVDHAMGAVSEILKGQYFRFLQKQMPLPVQDMPVFEERFWDIIEFDSSKAEYVELQGIKYFKYPLSENYAHIPMLYNVMFTPTTILKEGEDYIIQGNLLTNPDPTIADNPLSYGLTAEYSIFFKERPTSQSDPFNGDPFTNNDIAKRIVGNTTVIAMFAPKSFVDSFDLYKEYGALINTPALSSEEYKNFLHGMFYLYLQGPTIAALNAGINLAAGYPIVRQTDTVISVEISIDPETDTNEFILTTQKGDLYVIPRKVVTDFNDSTNTPYDVVFPLLKLSKKTGTNLITNQSYTNPDFSDPSILPGIYPVYFEIDRMDTFLDNLKVVDNQSEPNWWRQQLGQLSAEMAPSLTDLQRRDPEIQDFLFQKYFKYNTFGVFIDLRVLRAEFQLVNTFFDVIADVKPTFKSFIISENDLKVVTIVNSGNTYTDPKDLDDNGNITPQFSEGVTFGYNFELETTVGELHTIGMALPTGVDEYVPIRIGMDLDNIGSSFDMPSWVLDIQSDETGGARTEYYIDSGETLAVGMGEPDRHGVIQPTTIGLRANERVVNHVTMQKTEAPLLSSINFTGSGTYIIRIEWLASAGCDEYVVLKDGKPAVYTTDLYYEEATSDLDTVYEVMALYDGFLSKTSRKGFILPVHVVLLYMLREGYGTDVNDLGDGDNDAIILNAVVNDDLPPPIIPILYYRLENNLNDSSPNGNNAVSLAAILGNPKIFNYTFYENTGAAVHSSQGPDAGILLSEINHLVQNLTFLGQSDPITDSSEYNNQASLESTPVDDFVLKPKFNNTLTDDTIHTNDSTIESIAATPSFIFNYEFGSQDVTDTEGNNDASIVVEPVQYTEVVQYNFENQDLTDTSGRANDAEVETRTDIDLNFFNLKYELSEGAGITIGDSAFIAQDASIINTNPFPFTNDLVAAYRFENDADDGSPNGLHGSLIRSASCISKKLYLPAGYPRNYVELPTGVLDTLEDFTISAWLKFETTSIARYNSLINATTQTSSEAFVWFYKGDRFILRYDGNSYAFTSTPEMKTNTEHHVTIVREAGNAKLYIDGVLKDTISVSTAALSVDNKIFVGTDFIAGYFDYNHNLAGYIDNLFIYNRSLDSTEINTVKNYIRT